MKTLILYSGHLGSTAKAAKILADIIGESTILDTALKPKVHFKEYDNVIFGTNVRMSMLNRRFKKYAKKWCKSKSENRVFAYIIGATCEKSAKYISKAEKCLGGNAFVVFAGGELNSQNAKGFAKTVIESVKADLIAKGKALPEVDKIALESIYDAIKNHGKNINH